MKELVNTRFYRMKVDAEKNRVYFKILGFWGSRQNVPNYLDDWRKTLKELRPGFTILTDLTESKMPSEDAVELHEQAQKLVMEAGLSKVAELRPEADPLVQRQYDELSRTTSMQKRVFTDFDKAEAWLNGEVEEKKSLLGRLFGR